MRRSKGAERRPEDAGLVRAVVRWFGASARDLPWRVPDASTGRRNPYHALVSEIMLQQTQVSRVVERFPLFMERFPTVSDLASADEAEVLALWSGMGYYRRARFLHAGAKEVVRLHGGIVPDDPKLVGALPGVGRYTAGAVASICFGKAAPIVDGNIRRVLMRVFGRRGPQAGPRVERWAWALAGRLVGAAAALRPPAPGPFNEGLMELGATVCTPRAPRCGDCPLRSRCVAFAENLTGQIPPARARSVRRPLICASVVLRDEADRLLVERRPQRGMWGGLWQAPTVESDTEPSVLDLAAIIDGHRPGRVVTSFDHPTTHREVRFVVRSGTVLGPEPASRVQRARVDRRWLHPAEIADLPLSSPQRRVLLEIGAGVAARAGAVP